MKKGKKSPGRDPKESLTWSNKKPTPSSGSSSVLVSDSKTSSWILGVLRTANNKTELSKGQVEALVDEAFRGGSK